MSETVWVKHILVWQINALEHVWVTEVLPAPRMVNVALKALTTFDHLGAGRRLRQYLLPSDERYVLSWQPPNDRKSLQ